MVKNQHLPPCFILYWANPAILCIYIQRFSTGGNKLTRIHHQRHDQSCPAVFYFSWFFLKELVTVHDIEKLLVCNPCQSYPPLYHNHPCFFMFFFFLSLVFFYRSKRLFSGFFLSKDTRTVNTWHFLSTFFFRRLRNSLFLWCIVLHLYHFARVKNIEYSFQKDEPAFYGH